MTACRSTCRATPVPRPTKAYYVEVPIRGRSTVLVHAGSAAEAVELVAQGNGTPSESDVWRVGRGRATRAPDEDP